MVTTPRRPWWQATRTPGSGIVLGILWLAFGLIRWFTRDPGDRLDLALACAFVVLGAAYVVSSVVLLRRERADGAAAQD